MDILSLVLLGVALAADAMAVTLSNALCVPHMQRSKAVAMPVAFGFFQALMPVLGFFLGSFFTDFLMRYSGIVVLLILGFLGIRMVKSGIEEMNAPLECSPDHNDDIFGFKTIVIQALATSIDALAVGVSFAALGANIWLAASVIGVVTCACCFIALKIGFKLGARFGAVAEVFGGIVLVAIGVKALF